MDHGCGRRRADKGLKRNGAAFGPLRLQMTPVIIGAACRGRPGLPAPCRRRPGRARLPDLPVPCRRRARQRASGEAPGPPLGQGFPIRTRASTGVREGLDPDRGTSSPGLGCQTHRDGVVMRRPPGAAQRALIGRSAQAARADRVGPPNSFRGRHEGRAGCGHKSVAQTLRRPPEAPARRRDFIVRLRSLSSIKRRRAPLPSSRPWALLRRPDKSSMRQARTDLG